VNYTIGYGIEEQLKIYHSPHFLVGKFLLCPVKYCASMAVWELKGAAEGAMSQMQRDGI
jgi:hypothetical protein